MDRKFRIGTRRRAQKTQERHEPKGEFRPEVPAPFCGNDGDHADGRVKIPVQMHHGQAGIRQVVDRGMEVHAGEPAHSAVKSPVERARCVSQLPQNGAGPVRRWRNFGGPVPKPTLVVPSIEMDLGTGFSSKQT